jgi:hypothetical protein
LTDVERGLERGLTFTCDEENEWQVEGVDYDEDQGWVVYYYPADGAAPSMLEECEYSSTGEVLKWAKDVDWEQQDGDTREEQGIQLSSIATANRSRKAPVKADVVAALRAAAANSE